MTEDKPRRSDTLGLVTTAWVQPEDLPSYTLAQIRDDLAATKADSGDLVAFHVFQGSCVRRLPWDHRLPTAWHDGSFPGLYAFLREYVLGAQLAYVETPLSEALRRLDALIAEVERHEATTEEKP